jgi:hypothetical protein
MREHVKILGILNIVMGGLTAMGGLVILLATGSIASLIVMGLQDSGDADGARFAAPIVGLIGSIIGIFFLVGFAALQKLVSHLDDCDLRPEPDSLSDRDGTGYLWTLGFAE